MTFWRSREIQRKNKSFCRPVYDHSYCHVLCHVLPGGTRMDPGPQFHQLFISVSLGSLVVSVPEVRVTWRMHPAVRWRRRALVLGWVMNTSIRCSASMLSTWRFHGFLEWQPVIRAATQHVFAFLEIGKMCRAIEIEIVGPPLCYSIYFYRWTCFRFGDCERLQGVERSKRNSGIGSPVDQLGSSSVGWDRCNPMLGWTCDMDKVIQSQPWNTGGQMSMVRSGTLQNLRHRSHSLCPKNMVSRWEWDVSQIQSNSLEIATECVLCCNHWSTEALPSIPGPHAARGPFSWCGICAFFHYAAFGGWLGGSSFVLMSTIDVCIP